MNENELNLEDIRVKQGLKMQDVALITGLPFNTVKNVEQNFPNVNYRTLSEICTALNISIDFSEKPIAKNCNV